MRRKDREVKDVEDIMNIIDKCDVCRLAFSEGDMPYIVPMNFGYEYADDTLTLFFHCALEGKKLDMININPNVSFEMDCSHKLVTGEAACDYSMEYESVIGFGTVEYVLDRNGKIAALSALMKKYAKGRTFSYSDEMLNSVMIFKVLVTGFTGKRHIH